MRSGAYVRSNVSGFSPTNDMPCRQRLQDTVATITAIAMSWIVSTVTRCDCISHAAEIGCDRDSPLPFGEFRLHNRQWYSCDFPSLSRSSLLKIWPINLSAMTQASVAMMLSSFFLFLLSLQPNPRVPALVSFVERLLHVSFSLAQLQMQEAQDGVG